jgi:hypothetical protein
VTAEPACGRSSEAATTSLTGRECFCDPAGSGSTVALATKRHSPSREPVPGLFPRNPGPTAPVFSMLVPTPKLSRPTACSPRADLPVVAHVPGRITGRVLRNRTLPRSLYLEDRHFSEFETGNMTLSTYDKTKMGLPHEVNRISVALHVDDAPRAGSCSRSVASASTETRSTPGYVPGRFLGPGRERADAPPPVRAPAHGPLAAVL